MSFYVVKILGMLYLPDILKYVVYFSVICWDFHFTNTYYFSITWTVKGIRKETYSSTEVVLVAEVLKLIASGYIAFRDVSDTGGQI